MTNTTATKLHIGNGILKPGTRPIRVFVDDDGEYWLCDADVDPKSEDFRAPWCPPCRGFAPVFAVAAKRHPNMVFCRVNTVEAPDLKAALEITSLPTLVIIKEGILVGTHEGYLKKETLETLLGQVNALDMNQLRESI